MSKGYLKVNIYMIRQGKIKYINELFKNKMKMKWQKKGNRLV